MPLIVTRLRQQGIYLFLCSDFGALRQNRSTLIENTALPKAKLCV